MHFMHKVKELQQEMNYSCTHRYKYNKPYFSSWCIKGTFTFAPLVKGPLPGSLRVKL